MKKHLTFPAHRGRFLGRLALLGLVAVPVAGAEDVLSREEILADMEAGMSAEQIRDQHRRQMTVLAATGEEASNTSFEALTACGYQPQRKEAVCGIEIRQQTGYGRPPRGGTEFVQLCVDYGDGEGFVPVNVNGVNVHDEVFDDTAPPWHFAAVLPADERLFSEPLAGQTLDARAILSFGLSPGGDCQFVPAFGDRRDFSIRLDSAPTEAEDSLLPLDAEAAS